jgi:hypothetical protein
MARVLLFVECVDPFCTTIILLISLTRSGLRDPKEVADEKRWVELWRGVPLPIRLRIRHDMEKPDEPRQVTEEDLKAIPPELLEND